MVRICDRSTCDPLLEALVSYIFGSSEGWYMTVVSDSAELERNIDYCPFCGTRLEGVPTAVSDKFTRPRRRKKTARLSS